MEIVTKDGACAWQLADQLWEQTADGRFSLSSVSDITPPATLVDLDYLVGARPAPGPSSNHYLPAVFNFCPANGKPLTVTGYKAHDLWLPPYGDGSGSRVVDDGQLGGAQAIATRLFEHLHSAGNRDLNESKESIEPPRKNGLNFFAADIGGYREALFALGRDGSFFLWQRGNGKWLELLTKGIPIGRTRLENWAWSVGLCGAKRGHSLLLAGEEGATLVKVKPLSLQYLCRRHEGRALGGPGDLEEHAYVPLQKSDGSVYLVSPNDTGWDSYPVAGADVGRMTRLSAPVRDRGSRRLLWIGEHGYLSLSQGPAGPQAQWTDWPNGAHARPEQGPPFLDGSGLRQLIFEDHNQYYLQLDVGANDHSETIKGYRLSTGHLSFKYNIRMETPWVRHDENLEPTTREVVYPFIEFKSEKLLLSVRIDQNKPLDDFFQSDEKVEAQYCLDKIGGNRFALKALVSQPWNAQWFFFDNALWLYIDSCGALYRWNA